MSKLQNIQTHMINVDDNNPFAEDALNRRDAVNTVQTLIENISTGVICVNARWGEGKTTFIKMLKACLDKNSDASKIRTVYYDAWQHDYETNPFPSLVNSVLTDLDITSEPFKKNLIESAKKAFSVIAGFMPFLLNVFKPELSSAASSFNDGFQKLLDQIPIGKTDEDDPIEKFKQALQQYIAALKDDTKEFRLVLFIDELDRCRPTYAIEVLEQIKHIFGIENIIFVISVDRDQLSRSIGTIYGIGYNANGYLSKFFDVEYKLHNELRAYNLVPEYGPDDSSILRRMAVSISYREMLQIINYEKLVSQLSPSQYDPVSIGTPARLFLLMLRYLSYDTYDRLLNNNKITLAFIEEILSKFNLSMDNLTENEVRGLVNILWSFFTTEEYDSIIKECTDQTFQFELTSQKMLIMQMSTGALIRRQSLKQSIELIGQFNFQ